MLGEILLCALGAAGLLFIVWAIFGNLLLPLPKDTATILFLPAQAEDLERQVRAFVYLQNSRLLCGRLILLDRGSSDETVRLAQQLCREFDCVTYTKENGAITWLNEKNN